MNIVVSVKIVSDDQDIQTLPNGDLDFSKAHQAVSMYDLNAIEAARQLAGETGSVVAITTGASTIDDSKVKKNILARGVNELYIAAGDAYADMDSHATAEVLSTLVEEIGAYDLIICGDGSADEFCQQVDIQLAAKLGIPVVNAAIQLTDKGASLEVERMLEDEIETVEVPLPAVVSVVPDIAIPCIPGMKDILSAGKKPMHANSSIDAPKSSIQTNICRALKQADRKREIFDASEDGAIEKYVAALKSAL